MRTSPVDMSCDVAIPAEGLVPIWEAVVEQVFVEARARTATLPTVDVTIVVDVVDGQEALVYHITPRAHTLSAVVVDHLLTDATKIKLASSSLGLPTTWGFTVSAKVPLTPHTTHTPGPGWTLSTHTAHSFGAVLCVSRHRASLLHHRCLCQLQRYEDSNERYLRGTWVTVEES